jgi:hypothetical protein
MTEATTLIKAAAPFGSISDSNLAHTVCKPLASRSGDPALPAIALPANKAPLRYYLAALVVFFVRKSIVGCNILMIEIKTSIASRCDKAKT